MLRAQDSAESDNMVSRTLQSQTYTVHRTPQSQITRCTWPLQSQITWCAEHRRVRLHGAQNTAESDYMVSRTLQSKITQCTGHRRVRLQGAHCTAHRRVRLHGAQDTAESDSAVFFKTPYIEIFPNKKKHKNCTT